MKKLKLKQYVNIFSSIALCSLTQTNESQAQTANLPRLNQNQFQECVQRENDLVAELEAGITQSLDVSPYRNVNLQVATSISTAIQSDPAMRALRARLATHAELSPQERIASANQIEEFLNRNHLNFPVDQVACMSGYIFNQAEIHPVAQGDGTIRYEIADRATCVSERPLPPCEPNTVAAFGMTSAHANFSGEPGSNRSIAIVSAGNMSARLRFRDSFIEVQHLTVETRFDLETGNLIFTPNFTRASDRILEGIGHSRALTRDELLSRYLPPICNNFHARVPALHDSASRNDGGGGGSGNGAHGPVLMQGGQGFQGPRGSSGVMQDDAIHQRVIEMLQRSGAFEELGRPNSKSATPAS